MIFEVFNSDESNIRATCVPIRIGSSNAIFTKKFARFIFIQRNAVPFCICFFDGPNCD